MRNNKLREGRWLSQEHTQMRTGGSVLLMENGARRGLASCPAGRWGGWMMEWIINIRCCPLLVQPPNIIVEPHSALSLIEAWAISVGNLRHNGKYPQWEIKYWHYRTIRETSGVAYFLPLLLGIFTCSQAGMNSCKSPGTQLWKYRLLKCLGLGFGRWSMRSLI